jgi:RNA polymerase sigma factor (sigma-70 family)
LKVFISWSREVSKAGAEALREWLPRVLQAVKPWMSASDIFKGARWSAEIARELESTRVGIICVTRENLNSQWLLFETGALSKTLVDTFVCPYLIDLEPAELTGPLAQFQASRSDREDTKRLVKTINAAALESGLSEKRLDEAFDVWWPQLESSLKSIRTARTVKPPPVRSDRQILEEMLEIVRGLSRQSKDEQKMAEAKITVRSVLNSLPEKDRAILHAVFFGGMSKEDIEKDLGVSREYLRVLLHRAKRQFVDLYERDTNDFKEK